MRKGVEVGRSALLLSLLVILAAVICSVEARRKTNCGLKCYRYQIMYTTIT